jgi:hypothetical protein
MKEEILGAVVEVEKEIAHAIESEKKKSQEWLEKLRKETGHAVIKEKKLLQYSLNRYITKAKTLSEEKASQLVADSEATAERLEKISDEILKKIIRKYIIRILP